MVSDHDHGIYKLESDNEIRIALAGDWATGTDEAHLVGELIKKFDPHYSIHLGDVYYVGYRTEVDENFLGIKNQESQFEPCLWPYGSRGSFALNGNHEMYARGFAYFDRMLPTLGLITNGKPLGQKASFFCLENEFWRIIALDTGYNSIGLPTGLRPSTRAARLAAHCRVGAQGGSTRNCHPWSPSILFAVRLLVSKASQTVGRVRFRPRALVLGPRASYGDL